MCGGRPGGGEFPPSQLPLQTHQHLQSLNTAPKKSFKASSSKISQRRNDHLRESTIIIPSQCELCHQCHLKNKNEFSYFIFCLLACFPPTTLKQQHRRKKTQFQPQGAKSLQFLAPNSVRFLLRVLLDDETTHKSNNFFNRNLKASCLKRTECLFSYRSLFRYWDKNQPLRLHLQQAHLSAFILWTSVYSLLFCFLLLSLVDWAPLQWRRSQSDCATAPRGARWW